MDIEKHKKHSWFKLVGRFLFEVLVVFIGVYTAFLLNEWQNDKQAQQNRAKIYSLLSGEVESVIIGMQRQKANFDSLYFNPFFNRKKPTEKPVPHPYYKIHGNLNTTELEALLESGGIEAANKKLIQSLRHYNQSIQYFTQVSQTLNKFSVDKLSESKGRADSYFYNNENELKAKYEWYRHYVWRMHSSMEEVITSAKKLKLNLEPLKAK